MHLQLYEKGNEAIWLRSFSFVQQFRPRISETDMFGHVSNVAYPVYFEFARLDYLNAIGDPPDIVPLKTPIAFMHYAVQIDARYVRPCFYDEALTIRTRVATLGRTSMRIEHAITDAGNEIRALGQIVVVSVKDDRPEPWTTSQREAIERYEGRTFSLDQS